VSPNFNGVVFFKLILVILNVVSDNDLIAFSHFCLIFRKRIIHKQNNIFSLVKQVILSKAKLALFKMEVSEVFESHLAITGVMVLQKL